MNLSLFDLLHQFQEPSPKLKKQNMVLVSTHKKKKQQQKTHIVLCALKCIFFETIGFRKQSSYINLNSV